MAIQVYLIRHGETDWSVTRRYAGRADVPLTSRGDQQAQRLGELLRLTTFSHVWVSPLQRAVRTCELAGFGIGSRIEQNLIEWNFGSYEGSTTSAIRAQRPVWDLFRDGCPGGESAEQVGARVTLVIAELRALEGRVALFSHKQFLRSLTACWIGLTVQHARHFILDTGSVSILGDNHEGSVISRWNAGVNELLDNGQ